MKTWITTTAAVAAACVLGACAMPASKVESGAARPTLRLIGAPAGSSLVLDGATVGPADAYDGIHQVLTVEEGGHLVEVRQGGALLVSKKVFASTGESIKVDVTAGGQQ
jgi:hypothetical protein